VLFAFDLDRTLVTDDYHLPESMVAALGALRDAGHLVTVLTGRGLTSAQPYLDALGVQGAFSVNHGAQVMEGDVALRRTRLPADDVRRLLAPWHHYLDIEFSCVSDDLLLVRDPRDRRWSWAHTQTRSVQRFDPTAIPDADKVVFDASASNALVAERVARDLPHVERYLWGDDFLEVIGPGADKGSALAFLAERAGVPRAEVIAFGDGANDVSMLGYAGYAIAVGPHAHPGALAAADERVDAPESDGVARWIERFLRR
jgi:Cof subfamily protein (haloacid dehalogenase superfamily)